MLPEGLREPWPCLRSAFLHYCRPSSTQNPFAPAACQQVHASVLRYAQLMEERLPAHMSTLNLQYAVWHLPEQEERRGSTWADAEWWSERMVQWLKRLAAGRVSHRFEQVSR